MVTAAKTKSSVITAPSPATTESEEVSQLRLTVELLTREMDLMLRDLGHIHCMCEVVMTYFDPESESYPLSELDINGMIEVIAHIAREHEMYSY